MDMAEPIVKVCNILSTGDISEIKKLNLVCYNDVNTRADWAANATTWLAIINRLEALAQRDNTDSKDTLVPLLQYTNNLSASQISGKTSILCSFSERFIKLEFAGETETRLKWQVLCNLSFSLDETFIEKFGLQVQNLMFTGSLQQDELFRKKNFALLPYLYFVKNFLTILKQSPIKYIFLENGLLDNILKTFPYWIDGGSEYDAHISLTTQIVSITIENGLLPAILRNCKNNQDNRVILFKVIDSIFSSKNMSRIFLDQDFWCTKVGMEISSSFRDEVKEATLALIPFIGDVNRNNHTAFSCWNLECIVLEIIGTVLPCYNEEVVELYREEVLPILIALLKATKSLPSKSKLNEVIQNSELNPADFPYLKSGILSVLAYLVKGNSKAQDEVRISGGLTAILENCVIDANNPFVKERAIVCIRYLLDNNEENQKMVAALEARQVADPDMLEKVGYETEIINGKIRIKNK